MAQSDKQLTLDLSSGLNLRVMSLSPRFLSRLHTHLKKKRREKKSQNSGYPWMGDLTEQGHEGNFWDDGKGFG